MRINNSCVCGKTSVALLLSTVGCRWLAIADSMAMIDECAKISFQTRGEWSQKASKSKTNGDNRNLTD